MSGEDAHAPTDWRIDELRLEREQLAARKAGCDAEVERLQRLRAVADQAWGEHCATLQEIRNAQAALAATVRERGMVEGPDGRPYQGATDRERGLYDEFDQARGAEEERYRRWRDERMVPISGDPLGRTWTTRDPLALSSRIRDFEIASGRLNDRIATIDDEIRRLEEPTPEPVADPASAGLVARLRARIG